MAPGPTPKQARRKPHWVGGLGVLCTGAAFARLKMTVWIYDQGEELKVFATEEAARTWIEENDPEGVAFEYLVFEWQKNGPMQTTGWGR